MISQCLHDPDWRLRYAEKIMTRERALSRIPRGARIFVGSACGEPQYLVGGLTERASTWWTSEILHILTLGVAPYAEQPSRDQFRHNAFFIGDNTREAVAEGRADYTPVFLSELPDLFRSRRVRLDAALVQVSPPDRHGFVSLGVSVDVTLAAVESARYVVAEVNENVPRTLGYSFLPVDPASTRWWSTTPRSSNTCRRCPTRRRSGWPGSSPSSWRTAPPSRSASAPSPTPWCPPSCRRTTSGSTRRCSPAGSRTSSRRAW